jgi:hypothetical protein
MLEAQIDQDRVGPTVNRSLGEALLNMEVEPFCQCRRRILCSEVEHMSHRLRYHRARERLAPIETEPHVSLIFKQRAVSLPKSATHF